MANLPMIPWDEVPEGPVWFQHASDGSRWWLGKREGTRLLEDGCIVTSNPAITSYRFTPAEQQPGEWAAQLRAQGAALADAFQDLDRLRDGLAQVEYEIRDGASDFRAVVSPKSLRKRADRLAALREGSR